MIDHFVHKQARQGGGLYIDNLYGVSYSDLAVVCMGALVFVIQQAKASIIFGV